MAIYLIRHAHAGDRGAWRGDDNERPLSEKGRTQAQRIAEELDGAAIGHLYSSPAARCVETLEPLVERHDLTVEITTVFAEGADPDVAIAFLLDHASEHPAISTHGDVIPKIIRRLVASGMRTNDPNDSQKASAWLLEVRDGAVVEGRYLPPPA